MISGKHIILRLTPGVKKGISFKLGRSSLRCTTSTPLSAHSHSFAQIETIDPSPQGIQGEECGNFKLWQENCSRYLHATCDGQLQGIQTGRKTLGEVLAEQEKLIEDVVREYRAAARQHMDTGAQQGVQENYAGSSRDGGDVPCPQGIQGEDCIRYKMWLENCHRFGLQDCTQNVENLKGDRPTLAKIFLEQEKRIKEAVKKASALRQTKREFSTSATHQAETSKVQKDGESTDSTGTERGKETDAALGTEPSSELSQREKLKRAVKEYGSTVIVFHVGISLASLGFFYLLVSSGLDVAGFLMRMDIGGEIIKSKLAAGTGTFVIAYAVHKVFAPVRIAITLTSTPFIVRYLRQIGFLKVPKNKGKEQ